MNNPINKGDQKITESTTSNIESFLASSGRWLGRALDNLHSQSVRTVESIRQRELPQQIAASTQQFVRDTYIKFNSGELGKTLEDTKYSIAKSLRPSDQHAEAHDAFRDVNHGAYDNLDGAERQVFRRAMTQPEPRSENRPLATKTVEEDTGLYSNEHPRIKECKYINKNYGQQFLYPDTCIKKLDNDYRLKLDDSDDEFSA